jgi:hypothetical protein
METELHQYRNDAPWVVLFHHRMMKPQKVIMKKEISG